MRNGRGDFRGNGKGNRVPYSKKEKKYQAPAMGLKTLESRNGGAHKCVRSSQNQKKTL